MKQNFRHFGGLGHRAVSAGCWHYYCYLPAHAAAQLSRPGSEITLSPDLECWSPAWRWNIFCLWSMLDCKIWATNRSLKYEASRNIPAKWVIKVRITNNFSLLLFGLVPLNLRMSGDSSSWSNVCWWKNSLNYNFSPGSQPRVRQW